MTIRNGNAIDGSSGGRINIVNGIVKIKNSTVEGNDAKMHGGGIALGKNSALTVSNSIVTNNSIEGQYKK